MKAMRAYKNRALRSLEKKEKEREEEKVVVVKKRTILNK